MYDPNKEQTAFITDHGLYCYTVMPFGLKNSGTTYLKLINIVFEDLIGKKVKAYINNMVVISTMNTSHDHDLQDVLIVHYNIE